MSIFSNKQKWDYTQTLQKGISFVRSLRGGLTDDTGSREENMKRLKNEIENAHAIVIGAGAGLSTAAGFTYGGERFDRYFFDFKEHLGLTDMYSGGFYPFPDDETRWAFWARNIYVNRYMAPSKPVYLSSEDMTDYLSGALVAVIRGTLEDSLHRLGRMVFKWCVELNMGLHMLAVHFGVEDADRQALRDFAEDEVPGRAWAKGNLPDSE